MKSKNVVRKRNVNKKIIGIMILLALVIVAIIGIKAYAETTEEVTERKIANEESLVRMSAQLSRGVSTNSKVEKSTLATELEKYVGRGATTVSEKSSDTLLVTFVGTGNEYEIDIGSGALLEIVKVPSTEYTTPYLPTDFIPVEGTDLSNGFTIQDTSGNQYVWVEVPKTVYENASYNTETTEADRKPDSSTDYDDIEYCLHQYTVTYRNGTSAKDTWHSENQSGFASAEAYNEVKYAMLKSVYTNGGFYVGKYETGIADTEPTVIDDDNVEARTSDNGGIQPTETPVIQANAYPYNYVSNKQAQILASTKFEGGGYTTSLLFGVQWDLMLKHIETKAVECGINRDTIIAELNSNSQSWGNYRGSAWDTTTNANGKYTLDGITWKDGAYTPKYSNTPVLLSTGARDEFSKMGIYDIAGNVWEWSLEYNYYSLPCTGRGSDYNEIWGNYPASGRVGGFNEWDMSPRSGFRVALY